MHAALIFTSILLLSGPYIARATGLPTLIDLASQSSYATTLRMYGNYPDGVAGISVSAGDVNGDGLKDVILGALRSSPRERVRAGETYVVFGSKDLKYEDILDMNDPPEGVLRIHGAVAGDQFGRSVAAGDMDGDGYGDIIVSAWAASPSGRQGSGAAYVVFGSSELAREGVIDLAKPRSDVLIIYGQDAGDEFGELVYAGDVNGDGLADAIIGAPWADSPGRTNSGKVYVVFGSKDIRSKGVVDTRAGEGVLTLLGREASDALGYHVTAGDLNGDGIDEVIAGARWADPGGMAEAGAAYVLFGAKDAASWGTVDLAAERPGLTVLRGVHPGDNAGDRMNVGDVDGDGFGDLLVGAAGTDTPDGNQAGAVYVVFGSAGMNARAVIDLVPKTGEIVAIYGEHENDLLSMPFSGDVNGDGLDDLIVAAHSTVLNGKYHVGSGYLFFGSADLRKREAVDLRSPGMDMVRIDGDDANGYLGVSGDTGDIDGDGFDDIVISAHNSSPEGRTGAGKVYVVWGAPYAGGYIPGHFSFVADTGDSATVIIHRDALTGLGTPTIVKGDEIGVFTPSGVCAGAGVWTGSDLAITIWGDDPRREGVTGFRNGEPVYVFRVWIAGSSREYDIRPVFATPSGAYWTNAVIEVASFSSVYIITPVAEHTPEVYSLSRNSPNPFNPSTSVAFTTPRTGRVTIAVYSVLGSRVAVLADRIFSAGSHRLTWNAAGFASGVYFCRMEAEGFSETRRMLLAK